MESTECQAFVPSASTTRRTYQMYPIWGRFRESRATPQGTGCPVHTKRLRGQGARMPSQRLAFSVMAETHIDTCAMLAHYLLKECIHTNGKGFDSRHSGWRSSQAALLVRVRYILQKDSGTSDNHIVAEHFHSTGVGAQPVRCTLFLVRQSPQTRSGYRRDQLAPVGVVKAVIAIRSSPAFLSRWGA